MKFHKEFLLDLMESADDNVIVETKHIGSRRWSQTHQMVFKHEDKLYAAVYSVGSTECQDEGPFEYDGDEIECKEVFAVTKTITVYE